MKLSTRARYATRALVDLALHHEAPPVQLKDIARRQQISQRYLEHLITRKDQNENVAPDRKKSTARKGRIDGISALLDALGVAFPYYQVGGEAASVYEERFRMGEEMLTVL